MSLSQCDWVGQWWVWWVLPAVQLLFTRHCVWVCSCKATVTFLQFELVMDHPRWQQVLNQGLLKFEVVLWCCLSVEVEVVLLS